MSQKGKVIGRYVRKKLSEKVKKIRYAALLV